MTHRRPNISDCALHLHIHACYLLWVNGLGYILDVPHLVSVINPGHVYGVCYLCYLPSYYILGYILPHLVSVSNPGHVYGVCYLCYLPSYYILGYILPHLVSVSNPGHVYGVCYLCYLPSLPPLTATPCPDNNHTTCT